MHRPRSCTRQVTPSLFISLLALFLALSGTAYAMSKGEVKTANLANGSVTTAKLAHNAVISRKIKQGEVWGSDLAMGAIGSDQVSDRSLRLHDLGGPRAGLLVTPTNMSIPANSCRLVFLRTAAPAPNLLGAMVIGYLADGETGGAVLDNNGVVLPTMVSTTTQSSAGEVRFNLMLCDGGGSGQTIPKGSLLYYRVIGA